MNQYHALGCVCAFPVLSPDLPERQQAMRERMIVARKNETQNKVNMLASRGRDWNAALIILTSRAFNRDGRVWRHVDLDQGEIHFKKILNNYTFSGGERRLLKIAASLFNQEFKLNLWDSLAGFDGYFTEVAIKAISTYMGIRR